MTTLFPKPLDKSVSQTQDGLAIVANGNTHAAISSGQFVYVKNHDTLAEGLYKATSAIAQDGALSTSNLTPDGGGGLNDLQSQVTALSSKFTLLQVGTMTSDQNGIIHFKGVYDEQVYTLVSCHTTDSNNRWFTGVMNARNAEYGESVVMYQYNGNILKSTTVNNLWLLLYKYN